MKVRFTTCIYDLVSGKDNKIENAKNVRQAIMDIFGVKTFFLRDDEVFSILSSSDAFVRFQVQRQKLGLVGRWSVLKVLIVEEEETVIRNFISHY